MGSPLNLRYTFPVSSTNVQVNYQRGGVELPAHGLWLDPGSPRPLAFVSHAHSDHIGRHQEVIVSPGTARLMRERLPDRNQERREHIVPFGELFELPGMRITLLPAGHIFGSSQFHLESDAGSLLYSGDFKLRAGLSAECAECRRADTLIMETTFGLPHYRFPPTEEVLAQVIAFCRQALDDNAVPVLLSYSLGKSQEIICALLQANLVPMLHPAVFRMTEIYRSLRDGFPEGYIQFDENALEGKVLVCPPNTLRSPMVQRIPKRRTAVLTGWAIDKGARFRYGADAAFPLSDHADYDDLLEYVKRVQPRRVFTLHGFAAAFARDLRGLGVEAWALSEENQLEFSFR